MLFETHYAPLDPQVARAVEQAVRADMQAWKRWTDLPSLAAALDEVAPARLLVAVADAGDVALAWWRELRRRRPRAQLLICCRECPEETWRRWIAAGARGVLRAPFRDIDLDAEFTDEPAVTNVFRRHPGLQDQGKILFRYSFPSDPQYISGIVHMVSLLALEFGFSAEDYTMNLPLAVDEAVSNAIIHGNRRDASKRVEVEGVVDAGQLRIKVRDEGEGFRREAERDPLDPKNLLAPSGRGLFLIESLMDEVRFTLDGRCIEMLKRARRGGA